MRVYGVRRFWLSLLAGALLAPSLVGAHESGTVELHLLASSQVLRVELDAIDLDHLVGIRQAGTTKLTVGDIRRKAPAIHGYLVERLQIDGCRIAADDPKIGIRTTAQPRLTVDLDLACGQVPGTLRIFSQVFDELPNYRTIVRAESENGAQLQVMNGGEATVALSQSGDRAGFVSFVVEGVVHILHGADHLVFLLLLVLPMAGRGSMRQRFLAVAGIVTAFTISHSITLGLSTLGRLYLPSGPVEILIAASVVLVALMNLSGRFEKLAWPVAYVFGLVHGFGFAGAFSELASGASIGWRELLAFNLGVELGQLAVIAGALLLLRLLEPRRFLFRNLVPAGSVAAACIGLIWIIERV